MSNQEEKFYTYIYLDPRHQGTFNYDDGKLILDNLPIYVGKGYDDRCNDHIRDAKNLNKESDKLNLLREILEEGLEPIIIKVLENVSEKEAFDKERYVIRVVGRVDKGLGPLTNKTDGGQGGSGTKLKVCLVGRKFGRLKVLEECGRNKQGRITWNCLCDCGNEKVIMGKNLVRGASKSCGCLRKEISTVRATKHNMVDTYEYRTWWNITQQCNNPLHRRYKYNGGRGIQVCERWLDLDNFIKDIGKRPSEKHKLIRIDKKWRFF